MDIEFTRGRLAGVAAMLEYIKRIVTIDRERVSVAYRDDRPDDAELGFAAGRLADATADLISAIDALQDASQRLYFVGRHRGSHEDQGEE